MSTTIAERIFNVNPGQFDALCMELFQLQYHEVDIYGKYCRMIGKTPDSVRHPEDIPFLPITFFKTKRVIRNGLKAELVFQSSGTTEPQNRSRHHVADLSVYRRSIVDGFRLFYNDPADYQIFTLLPSYRNNPDSSLIHMIDTLMNASRGSGSIQSKTDTSVESIVRANDTGKTCMLFGSPRALLTIAEKGKLNLTNTIIVETGGMKGMGDEMSRMEFHAALNSRLHPKSVASEFGMAELLSQAYAVDGNSFNSPPWMRIAIRDVRDPLSRIDDGIGGIDIIDLANLNSCSFISTQDLGKLNANGSFEVLGRFDHSDIRGCNLISM